MARKNTLSRNFNQAIDLNDLKRMVGEVVAQIEDKLDERIDLYTIDSGIHPKDKIPTLKKGDIIFDFVTPDTVTPKQWDGQKFVTFNLGTMSGFVNLITQGIGSGFNPSLYLRSDGADGWTLDDPSESDAVEIQAAVNIAAYELVTITGLVADSSNTAHFGKVVGISEVAVLSGFIVHAVIEGEVTNPSWTWTPGDKIFLNGTALSTTAPSTGFNQFIATARSATTIFVRIQQPILI